MALRLCVVEKPPSFPTPPMALDNRDATNIPG